MRKARRAGALRVLLGGILLAGLPLGAGAHGADGSSGKVHRFSATRYHNTYSFAHPPALRIRPGDRVITKTLDARGHDETDTKVAEYWNPQTGPFFIEGAEPGDTLVVHLEKIRPNRTTAWSNQVLAPYAVDPAFLRAGGREVRGHPCADPANPLCEKWIVDPEKGVARTSTREILPGLVELPLQPMLGCIGVAPPGREAVASYTPGEFGGNMDYFGMNEGVTVMLPVFEPGALLFLGDGHARQGHGEVVGNALEISMDVEFSVEVVKGRSIEWPRAENDEYIMVLGSARPLLQALQHATTEMQAWLMAEYGYDERGASLLMGHALEIEIANVVDPHFTAVAKLRKAYLNERSH
jgi:acetamidase/formamidase